MTQTMESNAITHTRQRPCIGPVVVSTHVTRRATWSQTIAIRAIVRECRDFSAPACASKAHRIARIFRVQAPEAWFIEGGGSFDLDLCDIIENLEAIEPHSFPGECRDTHIDELNQLLARLYDWAEDANVFLGV